MELSLFAAFVGGVLTLLSPCSAMLLPAFFAYAFGSGVTVVERTGVFYLGLLTTLVPLGVLAGTVGAWFAAHRDVVITVAAGALIVFGLLQLTDRSFSLLRQPSSPGNSGTSALSVYLLGTAYGLAGVCAGPLLGMVLTLAATQGNALAGGILLVVFAAGMVTPLLILAIGWQHWALRRLARPRVLTFGRWSVTLSQLVGGVLSMCLGILFLVTQGTASLNGLVDAPTQFAIEGWVTSNLGGLPWWLSLAGLALVGASLAVAVTWSRRSQR